MHFEGRRACSQHLDPRELPENYGFRMFPLAWKPGVHQGKTHPNGGNDGFPQGKHQGFAWWRVRESLGPALPFPASAGPGRTSPGFHQGKVRIPPGFPQGKTRVVAWGKSGTPGKHLGKHQGVARGKAGFGRPRPTCQKIQRGMGNNVSLERSPRQSSTIDHIFLEFLGNPCPGGDFRGNPDAPGPGK